MNVNKVENKDFITREFFFSKSGKKYTYKEFSPTDYFDKRIELTADNGKLMKSKEYHGAKQLGDSFCRILKTDNINDTSTSKIFQNVGNKKNLDEICLCKGTNVLIADPKKGSKRLTYNFKTMRKGNPKVREFCETFGKIGQDVLKIASKRKVF